MFRPLCLLLRHRQQAAYQERWFLHQVARLGRQFLRQAARLGRRFLRRVAYWGCQFLHQAVCQGFQSTRLKALWVAKRKSESRMLTEELIP